MTSTSLTGQLREEYQRLFDFVENAKTIMSRMQTLDMEDADATDRTSRERATLVAALKQSNTARQEDAQSYAEAVLELNKQLRQRAEQVEDQQQQLTEHEIDLTESLSENRRLAAALRQATRVNKASVSGGGGGGGSGSSTGSNGSVAILQGGSI